jgi:apolipoprotein N-acyltransferase
MFTQGYLAAEIPVFREEGLTPYTVFGDWFALLLGITLLVALVRDSRRPHWENRLTDKTDTI